MRPDAAPDRVPEGVACNRVRELRERAGTITQKQLAGLVGVSRQTVVAIEKGRYSPSLDLAFRIAIALDRPIGEVFWYEPVG